MGRYTSTKSVSNLFFPSCLHSCILSSYKLHVCRHPQWGRTSSGTSGNAEYIQNTLCISHFAIQQKYLACFSIRQCRTCKTIFQGAVLASSALQQTATSYCTTSRLQLLLGFYCLITVMCNAKEVPADSSIDSAKPQEGGISLLTTTTTKWFACGSCEAHNVLAHKVTEMLLLRGCH